MEHAWIISSGTELTLGRAVDTNAAWLARELAGLGIRADRHVTVPDAVDAIREVLLEAAGACDVVLITGGLGPTDDDMTRQALAAAAGVPLELHAPSLKRLLTFFRERGREMPEPNRVQALIPRSGRVLPNECGTAPGIALDLWGTPCYALPGVPFEMKAMFAQEVAAELQAAAGGRVLISRHVYCFGRGESDLGAEMHDLMTPGRNPEVGLTAELGVIGVRMSAAAATRDEAAVLLNQTEADIRGRLGEVVFGSNGDTLSSVVGELLASTGQTLATAESCTGGLIGELLTDMPGSSRYYLGGVVSYANEIKQRLLGVSGEQLQQHGAVMQRSPERWRPAFAGFLGAVSASPSPGLPARAAGPPRNRSAWCTSGSLRRTA